jgi:hypothetical protein
MVRAKLRIDGNLAPGDSARAEMRWRIAATTRAVCPPFAVEETSIRTASCTITVCANCNALSLQTPSTTS